MSPCFLHEMLKGRITNQTHYTIIKRGAYRHLHFPTAEGRASPKKGINVVLHAIAKKALAALYIWMAALFKTAQPQLI